jgi:hypothetical protein
METHPAGGRISAPLHRRIRRRSLSLGILGAGALFGVYLALLSLANSPQYALEEFGRLWYWMAPLVAGFGLQVGLFAYARSAATAGSAPHGSGVVGSGTASAVSMVACCAHHLSEALPLVGMAGAGLFLGTYREHFLLLGILANLTGTVYLLSQLSRHRLYRQDSRLWSALLGRSWRPALPVTVMLSALVLGIAFLIDIR